MYDGVLSCVLSWEQGHSSSEDRVCPTLWWKCAKRCAKGADLLSHFTSSSYQVITDSLTKYHRGANTLVMVEKQHRSSCNYDSFLLPLLSRHNQLHQGWNNWFSIYANAMDLERGQANTPPCRLSCVTFKMEWRRFLIPARKQDGFASVVMTASRRGARLHVYQPEQPINRNQTFGWILPLPVYGALLCISWWRKIRLDSDMQRALPMNPPPPTSQPHSSNHRYKTDKQAFLLVSSILPLDPLVL